MIPMYLGLVGAIVILFAFFMNQTHRWKSTYVVYDLSNLIGALLMAYYSYDLRAWPFLALNLVWAAVSLRDIYITVNKGEKKRKGHIGHKRK